MRTSVVGAGLLVALGVLVAVAMGGVVADSHDEPAANASVGAEVSSFMQSSTAEAEGEVDDEMFAAALNRTDDPEERRRLVENRTQRLEDRQERLEDRRGEIRGQGDVRDRALAVRVSVGADRLERSINETEPVATSVGVDTGRLEELRTNARNLTGSEVSDLARGLAGPPADRPGAGGPPDDSRGPAAGDGPADGNGTASDARADGSGNVTVGGGDDGTTDDDGSDADDDPTSGETDDEGGDDGPDGTDAEASD